MYSTSTTHRARGTEEGKEGHRAGKYLNFFIVKKDSSGEKNKTVSCQNSSVPKPWNLLNGNIKSALLGSGFSQHKMCPVSSGGSRAQVGPQGVRSRVPLCGVSPEPGLPPAPPAQLQPQIPAPARSLHGMCEQLLGLSSLSCIQLWNQTPPAQQGGLSLQPKFASLQHHGQDRSQELAKTLPSAIPEPPASLGLSSGSTGAELSLPAQEERWGWMDHHPAYDSAENIPENPLFSVWGLDLEPELHQTSSRGVAVIGCWETLYHPFNLIIKHTVLQRHHLFNLDSKATTLKSYRKLFNRYQFWVELHSSNNIFYFRLIYSFFNNNKSYK